MARTERPLEGGPEPMRRFAADLRRLRQEAGSPPYRRLAERAHYSPAALAAAANGRRLPSLDVTLAYVRACGGDVAVWERRWRAVAAELVVAADDGTSEAASPGDSARGDGAGDGARAPYVGLAPFQPTDVDRFFGREDLVADLMRRVRRHRFVAVVGASGSGKSSVLRAGLIPAWTALSGAPPIIMFTPGPAPFEECALKLAALGGVDPPDVHRRLNGDRLGLHWVVRQVLDERAGDADLLIVVDQFEELFTLCAEAGDRDRFIAALLAAAAAASSRCRVVIGTRADFYAHCVAYPGLVDAFNEAHLAVGAMTMDELRRAVTQPALQHHLTLESALLAELVATAYGRVGVLPLLSHALRETWRRRRGNTLTLAGFRATGGIDGALTNTAESVYQALGSDRQQVARDLFSRLCALGDGTHDTKRRIRRDDLDLSDEDVRAVVEHFVAARLITVGQDWTEITHEILISSWPRLRQWLTADRDVLRLHQELTEASRQWEDIGRDPAALLRGVRLAAANEWTAAGRAALAPREHAFLAASNTLQEAERVAARRQRRRLRSLVAALTVLLVMVSGAMTAAILARRAAAHQRDVATAQNVAVAAAGLRATQPALANQLLLAAYRLAPTTPVRSALLGAFAQPYATVLTQPDGVAAMATGGRIMASAGADGAVSLSDVADPHRPRPVPTGGGRVTDALAITPDGAWLACGDRDGTVNLLATTGPTRGHLRPVDTGPPVTAVALSPDGTRLASAGADGLVQLWDVTGTGQPRPTAVLSGPASTVRAVAFSPDGRLIATAGDDGTLRLWPAGDGSAPVRPLDQLPVGHPLSTVAFSPDGHLIAAAGRDPDVALWSISGAGRPSDRTRLAGHTDAVTTLAFSPDSRTLASGSVDATVRLWDVREAGHAGALAILGGHIDTVTAVSFTTNGQTLLSASRDHTIRLWDVPGDVLDGHQSSVYAVAEAPDGHTIATSSYDRTVRLWDARDIDHPQAQATLRGHRGPVNTTTFRDDGRLLATGADDGTVQLWDLTRPDAPRQAGTPIDVASPVHTAAFDPHHAALAVAADRSLTLWNIRDPAHPAPLATLVPDQAAVWGAAFRPDGRLLAAGDAGGRVSLWDTTDPARPTRIGELTGHQDAVRSVAFSPDGHLLAAGGEDQTTSIWDLTRPREPVQLAVLTGDTDGIESVAFSPDGHLLATASSDRRVRLWDITNPHSIHETATLTGHSKPVDAVTFSRDGRYLITGSEDWTAILWRISGPDVAARICALAYPRLTRAQWDLFFPGISYHPPCHS